MVVLAVVCAGLGALLISWSVFLYEGEERRIDEILAAWWISMEDASVRSVSWHLAFVRRLSETISKWLNAVFGARLWSVRAVAASCCLSLSSAFVAQFVLGTRHKPAPITMLCLKFGIPAYLTYYAAVTETRALRHLKTTILVIVLACFGAAAVTPAIGIWRPSDIVAAYVLGLLLAILGDFAVVLTTRYLVRYCMNTTALRWSIVAAFIATAVGLCVSIVPFAVAYKARLPM